MAGAGRTRGQSRLARSRRSGAHGQAEPARRTHPDGATAPWGRSARSGAPRFALGRGARRRPAAGHGGGPLATDHHPAGSRSASRRGDYSNLSTALAHRAGFPGDQERRFGIARHSDARCRATAQDGGTGDRRCGAHHPTGGRARWRRSAGQRCRRCQYAGGRRGDWPDAGGQDAASAKSASAAFLTVAILDRRPAWWLELLLQTARTQDDARRLGSAGSDGCRIPHRQGCKLLSYTVHFCESRSRERGEGWGEGRSPEQLVLELDGYEGPIDLLLALARDQKVDLGRISILALADQYLDFITRQRQLRLEIAADYLVMAAWLAYLKSRLLLPQPPQDDEPSGAELAAVLEQRLRLLEAMQTAGSRLMARPRLGHDVFARGMPEELAVVAVPVYELGLYELLKAYGENRRRAVEAVLAIEPSAFHSVDEAVERLSRFLGHVPDWR